ncbi:MAG: hypothetical protein BV458_04290 [Thermoplasmata archaeon M9B2D]|nr:MAG: hypothetical protein BV458_04290 [Thermoplasmata archaeon M9B2D]
MKKLVSCIVICLMVLYGIGAAVTATNQDQRCFKKSTTIGRSYIDELDQSMTDFDGALPLGRTNIFGFYANLSIAQSFIPQKEVLTRTYFLMARNESTTYPCFLAVRENLTAKDLAIVSVEPSEFPSVNGTPTEEQVAWIEFNFSDVWVVPGKTYYLVVYTANITDNYYWISGNGTNIYPNGTVFLSIDDGKTWSEFTDADGCFKTYGLHETFLEITISPSSIKPTIVIKNVGNYTAWDVTVNCTVSGGLVLIGRIFSDSKSELLPGEEMTFQIGLILGFGKVLIRLQVTAANVKEIVHEQNAMILLFFIFLI